MVQELDTIRVEEQCAYVTKQFRHQCPYTVLAIMATHSSYMWCPPEGIHHTTLSVIFSDEIMPT